MGEYELIRTAELDEFRDILARTGWRADDFTVSEEVHDPATAEVEAEAGRVIVDRIRTHAVQEYHIGCGSSWLGEFADDLRAGKFGRP